MTAAKTQSAPPADPKQLTPAEAQKARLDGFMTTLEHRNEQITTLLSDSGVDPKRFLAVARRALTENPDLLKCRSDTLLKSFINCALDGLVPDGRQAAIVPYTMNYGKKDEYQIAQYQPMYQGYLEVAYRSKNFKMIEAQVVYDGDHFDYQQGDGAFIHHKPTQEGVAGKKVIGAYARAETVNGGIFREVMLLGDLQKLRATSKAKKGPRAEWGEQMDRKGPLRRLWKFLPKDAAMAQLERHDAEHDAIEAFPLGTPAPAAEPKRLQTGFRVVDQTPVDQEEERGGPGPDEGEQDQQGGNGPAVGADDDDDIDPAEFAASLNRTLPDFETLADIETALSEPINVRRLARLKAKEPAIHDALEKAIAGRRAELKKAAGGAGA